MIYFLRGAGDFPRGGHKKDAAQLSDSPLFRGLPLDTPRKGGVGGWGGKQASESFIAGHKEGQASLFLGPPLPR